MKIFAWLGTGFIILGSLLAALTVLPWNFASIGIGALFHLIVAINNKNNPLIVNWIFTFITMTIATIRFNGAF